MGARQGQQQQQQGPRDQSCAVTQERGGGHRTKPGSPRRSSTHQSRAVWHPITQSSVLLWVLLQPWPCCSG